MSAKKLKAIDFFCGGGGMSYGMKQAGIEILAGIDYEEKCRETYNANIGKEKFIKADVFKLTEKDLEKKLNLKRDDNDLILIGCSPCQFWSIINTDRTKSARSANLLFEFKRFVKYLNPGYVVVENVPGVFRRKKESGLDEFIDWLKENKYTIHAEIHNVKDYGVPQSRKRFTLIANRISLDKLTPAAINTKVTVRDTIGEHNGFFKIPPGHKDSSAFAHTVAGLNINNQKRLALTDHDGGNRLAWAGNKDLQIPTYQGRNDIFLDSYGRLWWDRPSPTITTKFFSISNGRFAHPEEDRALSLREGALLQSFPKDYIFKTTSIADTARIIGNAVPPRYAKSIGEAIINSHSNAI